MPTRTQNLGVSDVSSFGGIAAENDDIRKYFVKTPVYEEVSSGARQIVVGRKGAGKTALYLAVLNEAQRQGSIAVGLTFQDYPWQLHYKYQETNGDRYSRFVGSWRFLILVQALAQIVNLHSRTPLSNISSTLRALDEVKKFIENQWGTLSVDFKKTFPESGFRIAGASVKPAVMGNSLGGIDVVRGSGYGDTLSRLNDWLLECIKEIGAECPKIYLVFDELDLGFDPRNEDYLERIVGLLLAIRGLSKVFCDSRAKIFPIAFLRSDIFDCLHFGDKNKLTEHNSTQLIWNDLLEYEGCSLKALIDHRIREELRLSTTTSNPWLHVFEDKVMRGTQHKFHHIAARSYLRPRDVIKFCNCALDAAKRRLRAEGGENMILNQDVRAARPIYSAYLLRELDDEVAAADAGWSKYVELLRAVGRHRFTREEFVKVCETMGATADLSGRADEILDFLYRYSIVGFKRFAGGVGAVFQFRYMDETVRFDARAQEFMVHRGLKEAFELAETQDRSGASGTDDDE